LLGQVAFCGSEHVWLGTCDTGLAQWSSLWASICTCGGSLEQFPILEKMLFSRQAVILPQESERLLTEIAAARELLARVKYPTAMYIGRNGEVLGQRPFEYVEGLEISASEEGIVIAVLDLELAARRGLAVPPDEAVEDDLLGPLHLWYFRMLERAGGGRWKGYRPDGTVLCIEAGFLVHDECTFIKPGLVSVLDPYDGFLKEIEGLCRTSIETGEPIIVWSP